MGGASLLWWCGDAEDRQLLLQDCGDPQQVAVARVGLAALDALKGATAQSGRLAEGPLVVVCSGPQICDAFAQFATLLDDPVRVVARHSTKLDATCSDVSASPGAFSDGSSVVGQVL